MFPLDESILTPDQLEQLAIHRADCLAVKGREFCGYECMRCGLCTKASHGRHKARPCSCHADRDFGVPVVTGSCCCPKMPSGIERAGWCDHCPTHGRYKAEECRVHPPKKTS